MQSNPGLAVTARLPCRQDDGRTNPAMQAEEQVSHEIMSAGQHDPRLGSLDQRRWPEQVDHTDLERHHSQDQEMGTKNPEGTYISNMLRNLISQLLNNALFIYTYESKLCCYI